MAERVRKESPESKVIVMDLLPVHEEVVEYVSAGVSGFIIKDATIDDLVKTIRLASAGAHVLPPPMTSNTETGTGQGQVISPLLANIYLHYVLDEWLETVVKPRLRGAVHEIRFVDDFVLCFQYREDAERVLKVLPQRFGRYGLTLHPEKTRLLPFGPSVLREAQRGGGVPPETFDLLGFTHVATWSRRGHSTVHLRTMRKRFRRSLRAVMAWCREHRHDPVPAQCAVLNAQLEGHYQYYGRPTNYRALWRFHRAVRRIWRRWLNRRTRGTPLSWPAYASLLRRHPLRRPRITHPRAGSGSLA